MWKHLKKRDKKGEERKLFFVRNRGKGYSFWLHVLCLVSLKRKKTHIEEKDGAAEEEFIWRCCNNRGVDRGANCVCRKLHIAKLSYGSRPWIFHHCYFLYLCYLPHSLPYCHLFWKVFALSLSLSLSLSHRQMLEICFLFLVSV